jgi:cytochrome c-type biogenesis protein CcmE|tara:strand:- start:1483 stop:1890 length:408 start_codon:yes stop_codon:yes gene_type:complete
MNKVTTSILIVFLLIIGWIFYLTNIKQDSSLTVRYYSISELASELNDIQKVKVGGYIKPNSIEVSENDQLEVSFFVYQNDDSVKVYYYGIRPDLFKDDAEVVVSGSYNNNLISATELQTKCASRYEGDLKNIEKI